MAWYLIGYLLLFLAVGIVGLVDDWQSHQPLPYLCAMVLTLGIGIVSIWAFGVRSVGFAIGKWLWPMLAFALVMESWSMVSDMRTEIESFGPIEIAAVLIFVATTLPAFVLGAVAAARKVS